jgi:hypothetical protein
MAWIYSMWIDTETNLQSNSITEYFKDKDILANGKKYKVKVYQNGMITVDGISQIGITSKKDADEMTAIGHELYKLLKLAPEFRFAITGVEVDGWRSMQELEENPEDILITSGIVIREDIYKKLGSLGEFIEFKDNYVWTPYSGEKYLQQSR